jgi:hypothetical protein
MLYVNQLAIVPSRCRGGLGRPCLHEVGGDVPLTRFEKELS